MGRGYSGYHLKVGTREVGTRQVPIPFSGDGTGGGKEHAIGGRRAFVLGQRADEGSFRSHASISTPHCMHPLVARWLKTLRYRRTLQLQLVSIAGLDNPEILEKHLSPVLSAAYSLEGE